MAESERLHVFWHQDCLSHDTGAGVFEGVPSPLLDIQMPHPEGPDRLVNMRSVLQRGPVAPLLDWREGRHASDEELLTWCSADFLAKLKEADISGEIFSASTLMKPGAMRAIRAAAGTTIAAMDAILDGQTQKAYALVRPPGHHAARDQVDGYCFINNIGAAIEHGIGRGLGRVAVIDWDVHHGNGTQEGFYERDDVLTISLHMNHGSWSARTHPQTGKADERGRGKGLGYNINIPLPCGVGNHAYLLAFEEIVVPAVRAFAPELIVIAAGQDASQFDPNGRQCVDMQGFHQLGLAARALAAELTGGKLLMVQEGGYNPAYAAFCAHATVEGLLGAPAQLADPLSYIPDDAEMARRIVAALAQALRAGTLH